MWMTFGARTAIATRITHSDLYHTSATDLFVDLILEILFFFFLAFCLAAIGNMQGDRKVLVIRMVSHSSLWEMPSIAVITNSLKSRLVLRE
jgi:hypothetical protein